jgi:hypothetical protein
MNWSVDFANKHDFLEQLEESEAQDSWVYVDNQYRWVNVKDTEFLNIEEGFDGDVMTFEFNGNEYSSKIIFGSRPG